ncbi:hypothetical protein MLD38_040043 [Melastoma candidum]|uniref:Uncharacterized protein n=1 Tax=Melastoma candidum TaxID=119954 RepID=A0ACB9L443_9MYRT|nr:hypothetical protein MLD38_040043 [Melastoma candidum]
MEDVSAVVGPSGLIRKRELVRLIIQSLLSLGYSGSASCLESESGVRCQSPEFDSLESQVMSGCWEECIRTLDSIDGLVGDLRISVLFLLLRQYLWETLSEGEDGFALSVLRQEVSKFGIDRGRVRSLVYGFLVPRESGSSVDGCSLYELRRRLLKELEELIPPPCVLPHRRLETLVERAVLSQVDRCVYHNTSDAVSLYEDHCCSRDQIPTETIQILTDHENEVWFVQFSHRGELLASSSSDCTAIIWKVLEDGKVSMKHVFRGHKNPVSFAAWSPDDTKLLTCGNAEVVKLWDVESGMCLHTFGDQDFVVSACSWFPDSKRLVCGSSHSEKGISLWDCQGTEIKAWRGMRMPKIIDLAVTPDGENLISVLSDKDIRILSLMTNFERVISEEHPITSLSISRDSKYFIVNLNSQEIHLWDVIGSLKKPMRYVGHKQHKYVIRSCFGGVDCRFIASGSESSEVYMWNRQSGEPIEVLSGHKMTVNSVSWNPLRPQMLASASDDQTIRIWAPRSHSDER